jgi:nicotinate phosphoribosyltransferase
MISELYFKRGEFTRYSREELDKQDEEKANRFEELGVKFADFGTRRRYSFHNHSRVVHLFKECASSSFVGTSNVYLAMLNKLTAIGTHAHEWFMFHAAKYGFHEANRLSLQKWAEVYQGDLGIALSDTFTTDNFLGAFDLYHAKLFDGVRHDSGHPIEFAKKMIRFYESLRIDPMTKTIVFSDGLNVEKVAEIEEFCRGKIRTSYGIGTFLTNDLGPAALNMVIKMTACKPNGPEGSWIPTCKLSDEKGKYTGDPETIELCKKVLGI